MTFEDLGLNKPLLNALSDLNYTEPTTIQAKAFGPMLAGKDVIGIAQTGTGKTYAYLLPCLHQWKFSKIKNLEPQILILVPTRELVVQVVEETRKLVKYMNVTVGGIYGGSSISGQVTMIRGGLDILVATPGRLLDMVGKGELRLKTTKKLIIDEVDEMLDLGFRFQIVRIFNELPAKRQNLMFSATMTDNVEALVHEYFNYPEKIEAAPTGTPLENIEQSAYYVPNFNTKLTFLTELLRGPEMSKVLVFAATKKLADLIYDTIEPQFPEKIGVVHSNKAQSKRFESVKLFHDGVYRVLIATDLIARGIDISEVTHVINMDTPDTPENYMHRIGRTGRADKKGIAITLITEAEKEYQAEIEALMNTVIPILPLPEDLPISDVLIDAELPQIIMKSPVVKLVKKDETNQAFHEKSAKRQKVNNKIRRREKMHAKYGKLQTRGQKIKKKK